VKAKGWDTFFNIRADDPDTTDSLEDQVAPGNEFTWNYIPMISQDANVFCTFPWISTFICFMATALISS